MQNAKTYLIIISLSLLVGFSISYAWNNKTIEQQLEEQNTAILQDCLTKARMKELPSEILESASHCNKDLLKTIYSPLYSRTGATMNATGSIIPEPLWFQLIPQASATVEKESKLLKNDDLSVQLWMLKIPLVKNTDSKTNIWTSEASMIQGTPTVS